MKPLKTILLLLCMVIPLQAQFAVPPKTLSNGTSYTNTVEIQRDQMYRWVISLRGPAHVVVKVHSSWNGISSGYVRADSVSLSAGTGFTDFIVQASGDSLMNQWLPDDSGSTGTAGSVMKARPGWKATITVQALSSGNGGLIALSTTQLTYAPPADDDTYAYTRWLAGIDYATPDMIVSLPSRTGNAGKYLKTDGTDLSWDTPAGGSDTLLDGKPRLTNLENDLGQFTAGTSDSLQQAQADAKLALNIGQGKAGADSVHTVLVALSNLIAGRGGADSIYTQLVTLYNLVAGKPNADSVHTAIAAMLKMSDTTELHAQKFAVINDSLLAVSLRATSTANDLTAHASTADAHLPSQTGASGKFLQSNGTVSSWQTAVTTESDPTVALRIRDSLALYNLPWMRGDTAAIGRILDGMYPRSGGGGAVDTSRLMPGFAGQTKSYPGSITLSSGNFTATTGTVSAKTVVGDSSVFRTITIDSTGWVAADSLSYRIVCVAMPSGGNNGKKIGTTRMEVRWAANFNSVARRYRIVADSANGVNIRTVEIVVSYSAPGDDYSYNDWRRWSKINLAAQVAVIVNGNLSATITNIYKANCPVVVRGDYNTDLMLATVTVTYTMPSGNASALPIRIEQNHN